MGKKPHHARHWPVLGLIAVALLSGCSGPNRPPRLTPTFDPVTTATTPPLAPPKYTFALIPRCSALEQEIRELPPAARSDDLPSDDSPVRDCTFRGVNDDKSYVNFSVSLWVNSDNMLGLQPGSKRAQEEFTRLAAPKDEPASGLGIGQEARWSITNDRSFGCTLQLLDDNMMLSLSYVLNSEDPPRGEHCRGRATDLTTQLYTAIQPQ